LLWVQRAGCIRTSWTIIGSFRAYAWSDSGPEFVSRALLQWTVEQGIETAVIEPGKPRQNGTTESFNGSYATNA
jgi:transposase InsO family protein